MKHEETVVEDIFRSEEVVDDKKQGETEIRQKILEHYSTEGKKFELASDTNIGFILDKAVNITKEEALEIILAAIEYHDDDPNFPSETMTKLKMLSQEQKVIDDDEFELRTQAAILHYHSPYPEVRAVTEPFDDPDTPVETVRAYTLGLVWMCGATIVNTFFSPRQPAISLSATVLQLLLAPCGHLWARFMPQWSIKIRGKVISLNPGPWTFKEQMFATVIFSIASGPGGTYYIYLVQRLPQYLGQGWVSFGYEIILALSVQFFGFGFAGALRRFVIYPVKSIWPKTFPTLALNRALVAEEKKECINGWKLSRYHFFVTAAVIMFLYFWIPNYLFQALRSFNWMTWIAPQNFPLGMITGFYGGLGYNPWATFDWNVSGSGYLVTPFFSTLQQYIARFLSGFIIIGMYWSNTYWASYTPINSNEAFDNTAGVYNLSRVLTNGKLDKKKYTEYGPPYFSGVLIAGQGSWFAWYTMVLFYVCIDQWSIIKGAAIDAYKGLTRKVAFSRGHSDPHSRMMLAYNEVPDWWFFVILVISLVFGIAALRAYPTETPVWSLFAILGISAVLIVPAALLLSVANVSLGFNVLFQLLGGLWFPGNPESSILVTAFGQNFDSQTDSYLSSQKLGHYAKLPPRALFRGQMISVFINCFVFVGFLNWMITNFEDKGLCTWSQPNHFVCTDAVLVFASATEFGTFGVRNMFELYPILPWCFLIGAVIGISFALLRKYGSSIRYLASRKLSERLFERLNETVFKFIGRFKSFNPAVFWAGSLNWSGGNNLSYATNGMYLSLIFMYYIKRRYTAWFQKYNYLLESGFDVGVALSGIIQTFALQFTSHRTSIEWWGNTVAQAGVDYQSYNQNATLLPLPAKGYFGLEKDQYPMHF